MKKLELVFSGLGLRKWLRKIGLTPIRFCPLYSKTVSVCFDGAVSTELNEALTDMIGRIPLFDYI